jgi:hypothetical protein
MSQPVQNTLPDHGSGMGWLQKRVSGFRRERPSRKILLVAVTVWWGCDECDRFDSLAFDQFALVIRQITAAVVALLATTISCHRDAEIPGGQDGQERAR